MPLTVGLGGVAALLLFASVLLHELSHSLVALRKGLEVERITLFIFGGVSQMAREPDTPTDEVQIALAGPALSFVLAGMCMAVYLGSLPMGVEPFSALFLYLSLVNLALGTFNLVPAFPLDGGRVLRAWFWNESRSFTQATISAARVGKALAILLMAMGLLLAISSGTFSGLWWVLIGIFLHRAAGSSGEHARFKASLSGITVAHVMSRPAIVLRPDLDLASAMENVFLRHDYAAYPVTGGGPVLGMITLQDVKAIPRESWPSRTVGDATLPLGNNLAAPGEEAMIVLERMLRSGHEQLPVLHDGCLVGMVTQRDILMAALHPPAPAG